MKFETVNDSEVTMKNMLVRFAMSFLLICLFVCFYRTEKVYPVCYNIDVRYTIH